MAAKCFGMTFMLDSTHATRPPDVRTAQASALTAEMLCPARVIAAGRGDVEIDEDERCRLGIDRLECVQASAPRDHLPDDRLWYAAPAVMSAVRI